MKKILTAVIIAVSLACAPIAAWANCTSGLVTYNGRTVWWTNCCYGGSCNTNYY
jgi:hypothetical protein